MSFCIVEFLSTNTKEIAIVHRKWLSGEQCYWPDFWRNQVRLNQALKSGMTPDFSKWILFNVSIVGNRFYESYEQAREKLSAAEYGSEFSSDETGRQEVTRKKRACTIITPADEDSDSDGQFTPTRTKTKRQLPPPPPVPVSSNSSAVSIDRTPNLVAVEYVLQQKQSVPSLAINSNSTTSQQLDLGSQHDQASSAHAGNHFDSSNNSFPGANLSTPSSSFGFGNFQNMVPSTSHFNIGIQNQHGNEFVQNDFVNLGGLSSTLNFIQKEQAVMSGKIDLALDMIRTIIQSGQMRNSLAELNEAPSLKLPISTLEEFELMERNILSNDSLKTSLISTLSVKGGNNQNQITYRIMATLMTDELMAAFTMAGQKHGKRGFQSSIFMQIVCQAVRSTRKGSIVTDKEVEKATEYWIKKAGTRIALAAKRLDKMTSATEEHDTSQ